MEKKVVSGIVLTLLLVGMLPLAFNIQRVESEAELLMHLDAEPPILINLSDPVCTQWHELYPTYCNWYHLDKWKDNNTNGILDRCDYIFLKDKDTGKRDRYHVEIVTVTLKVTNLTEPFNELYIEFRGDIQEFPFDNPICTRWHEVYPNYSAREPYYIHLSNWTDTNGSGNLTVSDEIVMTLQSPGEPGLVVPEIPGPEVLWYHVDEVKTDIIVTPDPWIPEDVYADGVINIFDINLVALAFGSRPGRPNWDERADIWPDGGDDLIDIFDLVRIAMHYGETDC